MKKAIRDRISEAKLVRFSCSATFQAHNPIQPTVIIFRQTVIIFQPTVIECRGA